jgi:(E)-4-hydroxy-3-methylbut-2-enyl-diphosphate synthase
VFTRDKTKIVNVGNVQVGGQNKVVVQSMTNTKTSNIKATLAQINKLYDIGVHLVRIAVPDQKSLNCVQEIVSKSPVPIIADIHFDYKLAIGSIESGVAKIRINPGNIGSNQKIQEIIKKAKEYNVPIRIGVNHGSLKKVKNKINLSLKIIKEYLTFFEAKDFHNIIVSLKASDIIATVKMNELFAKKYNYPLHIGITESGLGPQGIIKSSVGIGSILLKGIGDTARISLTGDPVKEIEYLLVLLKSISLRKEGVEIISCPTCGRTNVNLEKLTKEVQKKFSHSKESLKIAVMGCIVNGPGEASDADYGICATNQAGIIFSKGQKIKEVKADRLIEELLIQINSDKLIKKI